ncbi:cation diffusion facilitator family transporter, partial [Streptomyces anulatus]
MSDEKEAGSGGHSGNNTAIFAALAANLGIAVTKIIAWLLTGMSSMLAEGIHSAADSGNQILLLIGGKKAQKDADEDHPFGYGRERYLAGFVVSIIVFSLGGLFSLFEAYEKFHQMREPGAKQPSTDEAWW